MECICSEFCSGCLSKGKKMKLLCDLWTDEEFHKIISDIPIDPQLRCHLHMCWECEARIFKFIKFKQQMTRSHKFIEDYVKKPTQHKAIHPEGIPPLSTLTITALEIFDSSSVNKNNYCQTHPQSPFNVEVKIESEFSDDDRTLFDIITEEKSKENSQADHIFFNNISQKIIETKTVECSFSNITRKNNKKEIEAWQHKEPQKEAPVFQKEEALRKKNKLLKKEMRILKKLDRKRSSKKVKIKKKNDEEFLGFVKIDLTTEEIIKDRSDMASKGEYANSIFRCEHCIMPFGNEEDLKEHMQKKHSLVTKHKCDICTRSFPNSATFERHFRRHAARWRCTVCEHLSTSAAQALAHYRRAHQPTGEIHDLAAKAYGSYEEKPQDNSEIRLKSTDQIPCEHCPKTFRWRTSLRKHMETHNIESGQKRRPHCEPCNMTFTTTSNLNKHMQCSSKHQIQLKLMKLKQDPPDTSDPSLPDIENIKSSINSQKEQFPCPQCDKKFQWKGNLWRHLQSHAARANGALACIPCNRSFSSIATYKQHMEISRKHVSESEYKFMCSECGKRFYNKIKLRDHIDWEHLKKYSHVCSQCQKVFKSHTSLYLHRQVVHRLNNAEHLCDHCGKSFPNKTKLRSHVSALHTKDTPYKCTTCSARFSWHSCLSRHMRRVHKVKSVANNTTNLTTS